MFDESLPASQDDDLCFKLAKAYEVGYIDKSLAQFYLDATNRISNVERPAIGWWMLWNKYEHDVLALCGKKTMAHHYKQCLVWFIRAKMPVMIIKALVKVVKNDWKLSFKQWVGSILVIFTGTKITKVNRKVIKWISE
jgi:hypothetical protein